MTQVAGSGESKHAVHTLRHRDFAVFSFGTVISSLGTWAQYVGIGWAAKTFTDSTLLIGFAFSAQFMPSLLLSPVAGVVADRFDRRRIVILGNLAMVLPPLLVAILVQAGRANIANLIAIVFVGGIAQAFTMPATTAFVPALVPEAELQKAVALNAGLMNSTRIIGPGLGAFAIDIWGIAGGFYLNAVSFFGVVVSCVMVRVRPGPPAKSTDPFFARLGAGFQYAKSHDALRWLLLLVGVATFFAMHAPLLPVMTEDVLKGNVTTYAWLSAAPGVGATLGLVFAGEISGNRLRRTALVSATAAMGLALALVSASRIVVLSAVALAVFGLGHFLVSSLVTAMLMEETEDEYRGRVMGLYSTAAVGTVPVNAVVAGLIASFVGAPVTIALSAGTILGFLMWFVATGKHHRLQSASA